MTKLSLGAAALYASSASHGGRARHVKQRELTAPVAIDPAAARWFAVCTAPACERRVVEELREAGFRAYCPLGRKRVYFENGRRTKDSVVREFPVFSRYIFAGSPGRPVTRDLSNKIVSVLGDSRGPLAIPPLVIGAINEMEMAGAWDASKVEAKRIPFAPGVRVGILKGPFASFPATVEAVESEERLRVLVKFFGLERSVTVDAEQVEAA